MKSGLKNLCTKGSGVVGNGVLAVTKIPVVS
jgi:hypothetical protein